METEQRHGTHYRRNRDRCHMDADPHLPFQTGGRLDEPGVNGLTGHHMGGQRFDPLDFYVEAQASIAA